MTQAETRSIGYGIAASLALHIAVFVAVGIWMGLSAMQRLANMAAEPETEPQVTLVYADAFEVVPPPPEPKPAIPKQEYMRTTQNAGSESAPTKADFISDRNTVASAKVAATPGGDPTMPTLSGVDYPTRELANRDFKNGESKQDSAPSAKPAASPVLPSPPAPAMPKPSPPELTKQPVAEVPTPKPEVAKKVDSPTEKMMQELDRKVEEMAKKPAPVEIRRPPVDKPEMKEVAEPDAPPLMKTPDQLPVMKAEPVAEPLANTPRPEKDAFQPQTRVGKVAGGIDTPGSEDAVNAVATTRGRYTRRITSAVERNWHRLSQERPDSLQPGSLRVLFRVRKDGKIDPDIEILDQKAGALLTEFTMLAILKSQMPPIPEELLPVLDKEGRLEIEYEFTVHP